tara:strand:+ start:4287 stop:5090 length:804 start_codon:yes stop_codon:yes gene_type:complete
MLVQEKNIKGFSLLELIVVIVIVGIVSATAYPNFSKWKKEREVRQGAVKIQSLIKNINAQIERGTFAFVQVLITNTSGTALEIESKGMTMQNLSTRMNDGTNSWVTSPDERCDVTPPAATGDGPYWDTDASDPGELENYVYKLTLEDVTTDISEGSVCFSRHGKFYHTGEDLKDGGVRDFIYVCRRDFDGDLCNVEVGDSNTRLPPPAGNANDDYYKTVNWTRFGNVTISKMKNEYGTDDKGNKLFTGGTWIDIPYSDLSEDEDKDD